MKNQVSVCLLFAFNKIKRCIISKKLKVILLFTITFISSTLLFCNKAFAEDPVVVTGRVLSPNKHFGDNSEWIEISRYKDYSLIIRVDCLPLGRVHFNDGTTNLYRGYSTSYAKKCLDDWFKSLDCSSDLYRLSVGNTATDNLGCFHSLDHDVYSQVYSYSDSGELKGTGISLPVPAFSKSAFLLSYQEARNYVCYEYEKVTERSSDEAYANYKYLDESHHGTFLGIGRRHIALSWLRSPGKCIESAATAGPLFIGGSLSDRSVRNACYLRPALWVKTSIFGGIEYDVEKYLKPLDSFVGMEEFKSKVRRTIISNKQTRDEQGSSYQPPKLHMVLTGNPGTGKTSLARKLAEVYYNAGLIRKNHLVEVTRADLVGKYIGFTEQIVRSKLREAEGGILFIDEAYSLCESGEQDYGRHVIEELLTATQDNKCMVIVAGYAAEMQHFLDSNPGLTRRFCGNIINLPDYTADELIQIFNKHCLKRKVTLSLEAQVLLQKHFEEARRNPSFGNAGYVENLFEQIMSSKGNNASSARNIISVQDVSDVVDGCRPDRKLSIEEILHPFDSLIGMNDFKILIKDLICSSKQCDIDSSIGIKRQRPMLHMILKGNPGTGKTTVAQILGDVYYNAGMIRKNTVVKVERADLVGQYIGQTEAIVRDKLKEAEGGILFIDEAYSLCGDGNKDYGRHVIEGMLTALTENKCVVIAAGYPGKMDEFLRSNDGLKRRFPLQVILPDYTGYELFQIFQSLCNNSNLVLEQDAGNLLISYFDRLERGSTFGNAGYVKNFFDSVMRIRDRNLSRYSFGEQLTEEQMFEVRLIKSSYIHEAINSSL